MKFLILEKEEKKMWMLVSFVVIAAFFTLKEFKIIQMSAQFSREN